MRLELNLELNDVRTDLRLFILVEARPPARAARPEPEWRLSSLTGAKLRIMWQPPSHLLDRGGAQCEESPAGLPLLQLPDWRGGRQGGDLHHHHRGGGLHFLTNHLGLKQVHV